MSGISATLLINMQKFSKYISSAYAFNSLILKLQTTIVVRYFCGVSFKINNLFLYIKIYKVKFIKFQDN